MYTTDEICDYFARGIDCSQVVARYFVKETGLEEDVLLRLAAPFGGGCFQGLTCGSVAGAYLILGLLFGHDTHDTGKKKEHFIPLQQEFNRRFKERYPSTVCKEILGCDLSTPEGKTRIDEQNLFCTVCPGTVMTAIEIVEDIIRRERNTAENNI